MTLALEVIVFGLCERDCCLRVLLHEAVNSGVVASDEDLGAEAYILIAAHVEVIGAGRGSLSWQPCNVIGDLHEL